MWHKPCLFLYPGDRIMRDALPALALIPLVPEIRASAGVGAFGSETFGAVLDLYFAVAALIIRAHYLAHDEMIGLEVNLYGFGCCGSRFAYRGFMDKRVA